MTDNRDTLLAVLRESLARIEPEEHWTTLTAARDQNNHVCTCHHSRAARWCATGSVARTCSNETWLADLAIGALANAATEIGIGIPYRRDLPYDLSNVGFVAMINDLVGHDAILLVFRTAIAKLEAQLLLERVGEPEQVCEEA